MTKVLITIPDELLELIDKEAEARSVTRSRFMEDAARRELIRPATELVQTALEAARAVLTAVAQARTAGLPAGGEGVESVDR